MAVNGESTRKGANVDEASNHWLPYVAPMAVYMIFTAVVEPRMRSMYVIVYVTKVVAVAATLIAFRRPWKDVRPSVPMLAAGVVVGLLLCLAWVGGETLLRYPHPAILGKRIAYDPFSEIHDATQRALFLAARFAGLSLVVPAMEEIFWRSFLLRYLSRPEFEDIALNAFSWSAAAIMAVLFGVTHPEWLSAIIFAFAMALLLRKTGSLFACMVAHGVTNFALGIYVLSSGNWGLW